MHYLSKFVINEGFSSQITVISAIIGSFWPIYGKRRSSLLRLLHYQPYLLNHSPNFKDPGHFEKQGIRANYLL